MKHLAEQEQEQQQQEQEQELKQKHHPHANPGLEPQSFSAAWTGSAVRPEHVRSSCYQLAPSEGDLANCVQRAALKAAAAAALPLYK
ncbi:hypothetical protein AWZ03_004661 [Drosophila navojoa]|uniref:Uncharacterized protein n=1 Tax=Drosophila navojoa TaxID=7232 RepID=A0A484BJL8_DRONA|nr:hypothetical protein AWZ03_004661 [Drosophila navojoa]